MSLPLQVLRQLLTLSEKMASAAQSGDWDALPAIEDQRHRLIEPFLDAPMSSGPANAPEDARTLIESCQGHEKVVRSLVGIRLSELQVVLRASHPPPLSGG